MYTLFPKALDGLFDLVAQINDDCCGNDLS